MQQQKLVSLDVVIVFPEAGLNICFIVDFQTLTCVLEHTCARVRSHTHTYTHAITDRWIYSLHISPPVHWLNCSL